MFRYNIVLIEHTAGVKNNQGGDPSLLACMVQDQLNSCNLHGNTIRSTQYRYAERSTKVQDQGIHSISTIDIRLRMKVLYYESFRYL